MEGRGGVARSVVSGGRVQEGLEPVEESFQALKEGLCRWRMRGSIIKGKRDRI